MYIVTGGAGFIGSEIVKALNDRGVTDILVVDDMTRGHKFMNLHDCTIADYMDADEFLRAIDRDRLGGGVTAVLHQGACSDTMEFNGRYMMETNFTYSKHVLNYCVKRRVPLVYASSASVYGNSKTFVESPDNELPINMYAYSKLAFDQHVRSRLADIDTTVVGLRYFNVYGVRETLKGRMASMVYQLYKQIRDTGKARLFEGTEGYGHGEQRRDFIYAGDVADVNIFLAEAPVTKGIFNVGTGRSRSFNAIARAVIDIKGGGNIEYIPFNPALEGKYQSFTEADITALRAAGYNGEFTSLEDGIAKCCEQWDVRSSDASDS